MIRRLTVGFLGAGRMATALGKGFVRAGLVSARRVIASDPSEEACVCFTKEVGAKTVRSNGEVVKFADVLFLAVKPDQVGGVLGGIRERFREEQLLISIAAGVPLARLEAGLAAG